MPWPDAGRRASLRTLLALLQRGIVSGGDADELLQLLLRALDLSGVVLTDDWSYLGWNQTAGLPDGWIRTYDAVCGDDPSRESLVRAPPGTWWLLHRDCPDEAFRTPLYEAFLAHELRDSAVACLPSPIRGRVVVGFYRDRGRPPYDEDDALLFSLLYPHLVAALGTRRAMSALHEPRTESLEAALRRVRAHAFIVHPARRVEWSPAARRLFVERLGPLSAGGWRRLERALARAADDFYAARHGGMAQVLPGGIRAELAHVPPRPGEQRRVLVLLLDDRAGREAGGAATPAEELLSVRQRQIARLAARGRPVREIARALEIHETTIRHHLRNIYERLGIRRRSQLVGLVRSDEA